MQIEYSKEAVKHINQLDRTTKQRIKQAIENLVRLFIPEDKPMPDEIKAIEEANRSIEKFGTISHDAIDWD